jgi:large subunit ribosomal protein L15
MNLHTLRNTPGARHRRKRLGCGMGSGHGKTSCRGHKGQMARKGSSHKEGFEGGQMRLIRRIPKFGFKNPRARVFLPVNTGDLERFEPGTVADLAVLRRAGLVRGASLRVKILAKGRLTKKLTVKAAAFSAAARAAIEAAGGTWEVVAD